MVTEVIAPTEQIAVSAETLSQAFSLALDRMEAKKPKLDPLPMTEHKEETTAKHEATDIKTMSLWKFPVGAAVVGGFGGILPAKAIAKMDPAISHPTLADAAAVVFINLPWVKKFLGAPAVHAASIVLTLDGISNLLPVAGNTINAVVARLPSIGPKTPIQIPAFFSLGTVAKQGEYAHQGQGGGSRVVNRLAVTNI